jgi:hypothetical protein
MAYGEGNEAAFEDVKARIYKEVYGWRPLNWTHAADGRPSGSSLQAGEQELARRSPY